MSAAAGDGLGGPGLGREDAGDLARTDALATADGADGESRTQHPQVAFDSAAHVVGADDVFLPGVAPVRGHQRSASHGARPGLMPPSALKRPATTATATGAANSARGHRRVFSHGGAGSAIAADTAAVEATSAMPKGHKRSASKTEFILPPGHEERDRRRSLQRTGSGRSTGVTASASGVSGLARAGSAASASARRHLRSDSLAFSFRGHSRQASRTDSIYTLRQTTTNYRRKIFWLWGAKEGVDGSEQRHRTVVPNHCIPTDVAAQEHPNRRYLDNYVRTTKYTVLSFLPKNLFEQFHRFANLYFLFIVLLNWVPAINAFGKEISMMPVIFVLGVTAIKDIFEDRRRYLSDKRVNNSSCRIYQSSLGRYTKCLWKDLTVGDIVYLSCDEMIPADILVLRTSDDQGVCYIDTQNLDGEANLKQREVPKGFVARQETFEPQQFRSTLECDMPTTKIYRFHGSILHPWGERVPVGKDNLLLRECVLKNTSFVEGLVVYAGHESKALLNNGGPRYKRSNLERQINWEVIWCVAILVVLCFIGAVGSGLWLDTFSVYVPFLNTLIFEDTKPSFEAFLTFWTFVIILQIIIPLSLYVTIEMTKLLQIYLMHQDVEMFDQTCGKRVECRALNIPEELGQIQYIFCDKTGTLTENNMVFKRCVIGGVDYDHRSHSLSKAHKTTPERASIAVNPALAEMLTNMDIQQLIERTDGMANPLTESRLPQEFFLLLAVCNTVIVAKQPHVDPLTATGRVQQEKSNETVESDRVPVPGSVYEDRESGDSRFQLETPSPPPSSMSSVTSATAPLQPSLLTPKRPNRLFFQSNNHSAPSSKPLSPIASSPDGSPSSPQAPAVINAAETAPPASSAAATPQLNLWPRLPSILNPLSKIVSYGSTHSLLKHLSIGGRSTPTTGSSAPDVKPLYEAESPDELALVDAAYAYSCRLLKRTAQSVSVLLPGEGVVDFELLHVLPFDSVRKRMSVILLHPVTRERLLYCKGADSSMLPRLQVTSAAEVTQLEKTQAQMNAYAKLGLRVLVMARRTIDEAEYNEWVAKHTEAENALHIRDRLLFDSYNRIECNMKLLGATGIEDRLQEGVPETIANLREAGIVVWVLTGDKQETAINIAFSCRLFAQDMEIIKLNSRSRDAAENTIRRHLENIAAEEGGGGSTSCAANDDELRDVAVDGGGGAGDPDAFAAARRGKRPRALVVDGKTLIYILDRRANLQDSFLKLASHCGSVLCCRATPLQKAYIVRIVKEELHMRTLAIGDGANDVSMIQTADVGVGISGQEGMQAVMASDFAVSKFKYLERLILVHGHWNYDRLARMVLYFFYKNAAFVFVCFWYQLYCGFSGAVMIDQMYLMLYNLLFTSMPPMAIGVFDQDAPDTVLLEHPRLYSQGRLGQVYKPYSFWVNMADALYQSIVIFYVALGAYAGSDVDIWEFGTVICTECLFLMLLHLAVETKSWTIVHWMAVVLSILSYFAFALLYNGLCIECFGLKAPFWVMQHVMGTPNFWFVCWLAAVLGVLPRVFLKTTWNALYPSEVVQVRLATSSGSPLSPMSKRGMFRPNSAKSQRVFSARNSLFRNRSTLDKQDTEMKMMAY